MSNGHCPYCGYKKKKYMLTSGPELEMIWTDKTGDGEERQRRRILTTAEAFLRNWTKPLELPLASMMVTGQWFKDGLQLLMAYG